MPTPLWDETGCMTSFGLPVVDALLLSDGRHCYMRGYYVGRFSHGEGGCGEKLGGLLAEKLVGHFQGGSC